MKRKKQLTAAFVTNFVTTITSGYFMFKVLSGEIGNYEIWRIVFSIVGFVGFYILFALVVFNILKENKKVEK